MDFKTLRFNAKEIGFLIPDPRNQPTATAKQLESALQALSKENMLSLTATDCNHILTVLNKHILYSSEKVSGGVKTFLCETYAEIMFGIQKISFLPEVSNRMFQISGSKSEKFAIDLLSAVDGCQYEKNKASFSNDYFIGKPDIIIADGVKEIKTVHNLSNFMSLFFQKDSKGHQFQLQCYLDLVDVDNGEIVYVLTGLNGTERDRYIEYAKNKYTEDGLTEHEISRNLKKIERNCDFDHIPYEKRVFRRSFKKNPYMIRLAKKKVTAARAFLSKIDAKFNKDVFLLNGDGGDSKKDI